MPTPSGGFLSDFVPSMRELREVPTAETATLLGLGAMAALFGHSFDATVTDQLSHKSLASPFAPGETLGGARFQLASAFATYTVGRLTQSPRVAQVGGDLVRAQFLAQAMTAAIKMSARRTRPDGTRFSFPSGHTSVTFASATVLHRDLGWKVGVPAFAAATYVAASRIQEQRHFLSDVAFGAAIGIVAARAVTIGRGDARFAVAPMAAPGGGGVALTWVGRR
jgi:membrane-associated phospholipid phosphatase